MVKQPKMLEKGLIAIESQCATFHNKHVTTSAYLQDIN